MTGREKINVKLLPDKKTALDEVVVIGYGAVKKADLTGSVSNVKMGDIQDAPVLCIDQALQGRIAGADIMSTTGEPGATTSIRIRGTPVSYTHLLVKTNGISHGKHKPKITNAVSQPFQSPPPRSTTVGLSTFARDSQPG